MKKKEEYVFPKETIDSLKELGKVLKGIYKRMRSEGCDIVDGKIVNVETGEEWKPEQKIRAYKPSRDKN